MDTTSRRNHGPAQITPCSVDIMKTRTDGRWKGALPVPAPEGITTITRAQAAELIGCTPRTISRWADSGHLTKYLGPLGRVMFDADACLSLKPHFTAQQDRNARVIPEPARSTQHKRW